MPTPSLLITPEGSRTRSAAFTPSVVGGVREVAGRYGRAWEIVSGTTNYILNPRRDPSGTAWALSTSTWSVQQDTTVTDDGVPSHKLSSTGTGNLIYSGSCPVGSAVEGDVLRASGRLRCNRAGVRYTVRLHAQGLGYLDTGGVMITPSTDGWTDFTLTSNPLPDGVEAKGVRLYLYDHDTSQAGDTVWLVKPQIEKDITYKDFATPYTDGYMGQGHAWSGTPHASPSTRQGGYIDLSSYADLINANHGTMLIRWRKTIEQAANVTFTNNYVMWAGEHGNTEWLAYNQMGLEHRVIHRSGSGNAITNPNRAAIEVGMHNQMATRWKDEHADVRINDRPWQPWTRRKPQGEYGAQFYIGSPSSHLTVNGHVEAILIFDDVLSDTDINRLLNIDGQWTWENVQLYDLPRVRVPITSVQLIPKLYKATKDNVFVDEITSHVSKGKVTFNPDRSIKWDAQIRIDDHTLIRPWIDYIAPVLTLRYSDGSEDESQLGLYLSAPPAQTIATHGRDVALDGKDITWLLHNNVYTGQASVGAGAVVTDAIASILEAGGITRHNIQPSSATLPNGRTWPAGTTRLKVVNDLLSGIGYYSLYATKDGRVASKPYQSVSSPSVAAFYDTTDPYAKTKVTKTIKRDNTAADRIANRVTVIKANGSEPPLVGVAENTNPASPTSSVALGIVIDKVYNEHEVPDQAAADAMAKRRLEEASQLYERLTLTTTPDVLREPFEQYQLNIVDASGEVVADGIWNCRGWSIGFTPQDGYMTHELSNITNPPMEV